MLGTLFWAIYAFVCLSEIQSVKNIVLFTILSILPVYSQYGAVFPIAAMLIAAFIHVLLQKDKKNILTITISYLTALVFAAIPLFYFFAIKQIRNQQNENIRTTIFKVDGNIFTDMFRSFKEIVSWNLFSYYDKKVSTVFSWIFIICVVLFLIISKKAHVKMLAVTNMITWIMYYFAVKLNMYSFGSFGSRYNLFFIPLWLVSIFCFGYQIYDLLKAIVDKKYKVLLFLYAGICLALIVCFMVSSWTRKLKYNWDKREDMRLAVNTWLEVGAQDSHTIVYYAGDSGFAYYLREKEGYSPDMENNVAYMPRMKDRTAEEYTDYIKSLYGDRWPNEIYIIGTHVKEDINTIVSAFTDRGYSREDLNTSNCLLMRLSYTESD